MTGSPIPKREAVEMNLGRHGPRWYVVEGYAIRGGPFETEAEALAAIDAWLAEIWAYTEWIDAEARREGRTVQWGPR